MFAILSFNEYHSNMTLYYDRHRQLILDFNRALREGFIVRAEYCEWCGRGDCRIVGHHQDYNKPEEVEWICVSCHKREHNLADGNIPRRIIDKKYLDTDKDIAYDRDETFDRCSRMLEVSNQSIFGRLHNYA